MGVAEGFCKGCSLGSMGLELRLSGREMEASDDAGPNANPKYSPRWSWGSGFRA